MSPAYCLNEDDNFLLGREEGGKGRRRSMREALTWMIAVATDHDGPGGNCIGWEQILLIREKPQVRGFCG